MKVVVSRSKRAFVVFLTSNLVDENNELTESPEEKNAPRQGPNLRQPWSPASLQVLMCCARDFVPGRQIGRAHV